MSSRGRGELHCLIRVLLMLHSVQQLSDRQQKVALLLHSGSNVFHERADMPKSPY